VIGLGFEGFEESFPRGSEIMSLDVLDEISGS